MNTFKLRVCLSGYLLTMLASSVWLACREDPSRLPPPCTGMEAWPDPCAPMVLDAGVKDVGGE